MWYNKKNGGYVKEGKIILFVSDLDNTLIHSYKKASENDICVEVKKGKSLSFMTPCAFELLRKINEREDIVFSPLTTRSLEQYCRVDFFDGKSPELALAANGGILLENGVINKNWFEESKNMISDCYGEFEQGIRYFETDEYVYFDIRIVDELFVFTKSSAPLTTKAILNEVLDKTKVEAFNIGDKVYIFPKKLTKGLAIKRLRKLFKYDSIICAGDSEFDISMIEEADCGICPQFLSEQIASGNCIAFDTETRNFAEQILEYIQNL